MTRKMNEQGIIRRLNNSIGPEGIIGMKNMATNQKAISGFVKSGKMQEAVDYVKGQKKKVFEQSLSSKAKRMR